jgi:hypothetical protein
VELENLFDDGADADEAGVFFGVAEGDLVGEWHFYFDGSTTQVLVKRLR